ncbi:MAG: bifunctional oligoribonuclease/PAP phosphatase NrnA [Synergistaceae bacterium]|jgi:phosphoesterase RecJ-like protein|nr:bifunctional oligoribonuclease/PAP phosphatase NrnA [Synergistaceae bacterium]
MVKDIIELLETRASWLVLAHEKPDGDTIGCGAAIARLGLRTSKRVMFACPDPCPPRYAFLLSDLEMSVIDSIPSNFPGSGGVIVCTDTSTAGRSVPGISPGAMPCPVINIDHHCDNEMYGDVNWIDADASATGEMVTELMFGSPWGIRGDEATALYAALVSDNGGFSFASTTIKSHDCAMKLLASGASPQMIADELDSSLAVEDLRLWGAAMSRATTFADGECAIYWLTREDFARTGTSRQSTENLVNFLLRIRGVKAVALCSELAGPDGDGWVRASIRTRPPRSAREIAAVFGGGGHDLASGCTIKSSIEEAVSMLRAEMERHVSRPAADR